MKIHHLLFVIGISLEFFGCAKQDPDIVGRVGKAYEIDFDELSDFFELNYFYKRYTKDLQDYEIALNDMLTAHVKLLDFFDSGFDKDTLLLNRIRRIINEELVISYYDTQFLSKYESDQAIEEYDKVFKASADTGTIQWNNASINQIKEWAGPGGFNEMQYVAAIGQAVSDGQNFPILNHSNGEVDLLDYYRLLKDILLLSNPGNLSTDEFKAYIVEAVRTENVVQKASALDLEKAIISVNTKSEVLRDKLIWLYDQKIIESAMPDITDRVLRLFYEENKDSLFFQFAKVNIYAAVTADEVSTKELLQKLEQGVPFTKLMDRIFVKTFIQDHDGRILSFLNQEEPLLGEDAFKLELNELAGPVEYLDPEKGKQYAIIKCVGRRPAKQLQYSDVQNSIRIEYIESESLRIISEKERVLLDQYDSRIYKDVLAQKMGEIL
ncbi:MAG: peptidylprolyl isomerase [Bacteroidota bacterium]